MMAKAGSASGHISQLRLTAVVLCDMSRDVLLLGSGHMHMRIVGGAGEVLPKI